MVVLACGGMVRKSSGAFVGISEKLLDISFPMYSGSVMTIVPSFLSMKLVGLRSSSALQWVLIFLMVSSRDLRGYVGYFLKISSSV